MNIRDLSQTPPRDIAVNCLSVLRYIHHLRGLTVRGRGRSAFMLVVNGTFFYQFDGGKLTVEAGDIIYLPEGGRYRYALAEGRTECLQIEAEISVGGERVAFFDHPVKIVNNTARMREVMEALERGAGDMEKTAAVFTLLGSLVEKKHDLSAVSNRIFPAVEYLDKHFCEPVRMEKIAALCNVSQSQMRRVFRQELGMSPVEYKNRRRMEAACHMLRHTYNRVGEIADALGFDSVFVFSRVFRKYMGMSPTEYRNAGEQ